MKVYTEASNRGRLKAGDEIHRHTADGGLGMRYAIARAQRKAARRDGKAQCERELIEAFDEEAVDEGWGG